MKSQATIKRHLKQLRKLIDETNDPIEKRIAYTMEMAVRWATCKTVGWPGLVDEAKSQTMILKQELQTKPR